MTKQLKVYIASKYDNRLIVDMLATLMSYQIKNIEIMSKWHTKPRMNNFQDIAFMDIIKGVEACDILIAFYPYGESGTVTEITSAFYNNKYIIYCRTPDFANRDPLITGIFETNEKTYIASTTTEIFNILAEIKYKNMF